MVETTKNRGRDDVGSGAPARSPVSPWFGDTLVDALVWSRMNEILDVFVQDAPQVGLAHEQDVIQAFATQAADQPLTGSVRTRRADRRSEQGAPGSRDDRVEARAEFRIIVTDKTLRPRTEARG